MNTKKHGGSLAALAVVLCIAGCIPSVHPLYTPKDVVFNPALLGTWAKKDAKKERWVFAEGKLKDPAKTPGNYQLVYTDDSGRSGRFVVYLVRLGDRWFLDLFPEDPKLKQNGFYQLHLFPVHTFLLVREITPDLLLSPMDLDWFKKLLQEHPEALRHEVEDDRVLITASTRELQAFLPAHVDDPKAFSDPVPLLPVKTP